MRAPENGFSAQIMRDTFVRMMAPCLFASPQVCLMSDFPGGDMLPCKHQFHVPCIEAGMLDGQTSCAPNFPSCVMGRPINAAALAGGKGSHLPVIPGIVYSAS